MTPPATDQPVAVVTGAASGIGRACAGLTRQSGWRTAGIDLNPSETDLSLQADDPRVGYRTADLRHTPSAAGERRLAVVELSDSAQKHVEIHSGDQCGPVRTEDVRHHLWLDVEHAAEVWADLDPDGGFTNPVEVLEETGRIGDVVITMLVSS